MSKDDAYTNRYDRFLISNVNGKIYIILTDIYFWADNAHELEQWCNDYAVEYTGGMAVVLDNEQLLTNFILRWS